MDQHVVVGLHDVQEHPYRSEICLAGVEVMLAVDSMERARMVCEDEGIASLEEGRVLEMELRILNEVIEDDVN